MEKYPRGRRGSPAKGVGRVSVARVQIPPSPPIKRIRICGSFFILSGEEDLDPSAAVRTDALPAEGEARREQEELRSF